MNQDFIIVFKGSIVFSNRIVNELILNKINPIVKNESESARLAGFGFNIENEISIYVHLDEFEESQKIINNLRI
jgi:hypothetical protein|tara:strand:+ start:10670 stop:10891 length:222 start_codon:yes stop_codon:yes gene_type:complete